MNRGIARRTVFETREDFRYFFSRLARAVRREGLEVHAFCVMTTLLVRSPAGKLSEGMRRVQNEYVRRFNRMCKRDGPLFRGRFRSRLVDSRIYRHVLVQYIDSNPMSAGLTRVPHLYQFASARYYMACSGPAWLERSWIEQTVCAMGGTRTCDPEGYAAAFGTDQIHGISALFELRMEARSLRSRSP
ncbi:MAG: hypothetical protein KJ645_13250 [Planctomycetes bacterium]|nr:hypothetical protein [Planctomycetota bacterium]